MKIASLIFAVSVAGNVALLALVLTTAPANRGGPFAFFSGGGAGQTPATSHPASAADAELAKIDAGLWNSFGAGDFPGLVARLRAAGFPPALVRAIVVAQVNESFAARRKALAPPKTDLPFWKTDRPDLKTQAALRELSREQGKMLKELLGTPSPVDEERYAALLRRQYGDLPREKIDQISRVQQDYGELRNEIYSAAGLNGGGPPNLTPDDRAKLALIEKEQRADIARLLSPKELEDYELRTSSTASQMRYQLSAFGPTEDEFRAIFKLQRTFDEQYNANGMIMPGTLPSPELRSQRMEAEKQLTAQVKAALGDARGAEYERAIDNNFQQISRVVDRLELPKAAAVQVWELQKDVEQRSRAIYTDRTLVGAARDAQLAALAEEAKTKVTSALGQRGYDVYKQYGGFWLQGLQQRSGSGSGPRGSDAGGMILTPAR